MTQVITRFAPSPTGNLHLGGARTALFCYLFAKKHQGKFLLRIEDTDQERSKPEFTETILGALKWLDLPWDDEPVYQSNNLAKYQAVAAELLAQGHAYRCICTPAELEAMREEQTKRGDSNPKYDGRHRESDLGPETENFVVRFKNPTSGEVSFADLVQGEVKVSNEELDDMVLLRADGSPTYNFCAVVDDLAMGISHVMRGDDHLRNSLRQCNLYAALGATAPQFAHLPMILNQDGARLSKRDGADNLFNYRDRGILATALCSYMARLGWAHGDQEIFSRAELLELFDVTAIQKSPSGYDETKLLWMNNQFITATADEDLAPQLTELLQTKHNITAEQLANGLTDQQLAQAIALHKPKCDDLLALAAELPFYYTAPTAYDPEASAKFVNQASLAALGGLREQLAALSADKWQAEEIKALLKQALEDHELKFPQLAMPLRLALTGTGNSPSIDQVAAVLGQPATLARIDSFIGQAN